MSARRKKRPPPLPQIQTRDPREIVQLLLDGLPLSRVPKDLHIPLLVQLSAAKTENLVAGNITTARRLQNMMRQLDISVVKPAPSPRRPATARPECFSRSSLVSSLSGGDTSLLAKQSKSRLELAATTDYWNVEIGRYDEMRESAFTELESRYRDLIKSVDAEPRREPAPRPTSALIQLQEKQRALPLTLKTQDAKEELDSRISYISFLNVKNQRKRIDDEREARKAKLQEEYEAEKVELERRWDAKWEKLVQERRNDIRKKERQVRLCAVDPRLTNSLPAGRLPVVKT